MIRKAIEADLSTAPTPNKNWRIAARFNALIFIHKGAKKHEFRID